MTLGLAVVRRTTYRHFCMHFKQNTFGDQIEVDDPCHIRGAITVHPARHRDSGARLIVKALSTRHPDLARVRGEFENEATVLQAVSHRNLVPLFIRIDAPAAEGLVMPLLKGITVRQFLDRGRPSLRAAVHIIKQCIEALDYLHGLGITHRDLSPENLIFSTYSGRVRLIDFQSAGHPLKLFLGDEPPALYSLGYAAPEQITGTDVGRPADIYAIGVLFYELLAGRKPFPGTDPGRVAMSQLDESYFPVSEVDSRVTNAFDELIGTSLSAFPEGRFTRAVEMGEAITVACARVPDFEIGRSFFREAASDEDNAYVNVFAPPR